VITEALPLNPIARWGWVFPVVESLHLCGFTLLVGSAAIVDLRLMGLCLQRLRISELAATLSPWMWTGFFIQLVTGIFLFSGDPREYVQVAAFRNKMLLLVVAAIFQYGIVRRATAPDRDAAALTGRRLIGLASLALWTAVPLAGLWIGNL
jgi:hypothetical protein